MTHFGRRPFGPCNLPAEFSIGWIGMHKCMTGIGEQLPDDWRKQLEAKEPYWDQHPIAGIRYGHTHLHKGLKVIGQNGSVIDHPNHVHTEIVSKLSRFQKPIRIST